MSRYVIIFLFYIATFYQWSFASEVKGVREIYETPIPAEIRKNFNEYLCIRNSYHDYKQTVVDGKKFVDIYEKKFLVIGLEPNSFGGVWAIIAGEDDMRHIFRIRLYDIEKGVYDLGSVSEIPGQFGKEFLEELHATSYISYWM